MVIERWCRDGKRTRFGHLEELMTDKTRAGELSDAIRPTAIDDCFTDWRIVNICHPEWSYSIAHCIATS